MKLAASYQYVPAKSVDPDIKRLERMKYSNYIFLVRRGESWLCTPYRVYTKNSFANLTVTYGALTPWVPSVPLFFHVEDSVDGCPIGSVTMLDFQSLVCDIEAVEELPPPARQRHVKRFINRCTKNAKYSNYYDLIQFLKTGRC